MSETGWTWSQLGQEAISAVESELGPFNRDTTLRAMSSSSSHHESSGHLVPGDYPTSSSEESHPDNVTTKSGELRIPAAHAISNEVMPIPVMNSTGSTTSTPALSRRNSATVASPRSSVMLGLGPPVPSKRHSVHATANSNSTPRQSRGNTNVVESSPTSWPPPPLPIFATPPSEGREQQQAQQKKEEHHHVAPRARVSWVSVTDTEEDWVDAGEGGEELDAIFGTPSTNRSTSTTPGQTPNGHTNAFPEANLTSNKDLPHPPSPPPLLPYPYVSAPGSVFDSEAYRTSRQEVIASRPTSMFATRPLSSSFGSPHASASKATQEKSSTSATTTPPPPPVGSEPYTRPSEAEKEEHDLEAAQNGFGVATQSSESSSSSTQRVKARDSHASSGTGSWSVRPPSEVEYVGPATRHTFSSPTVQVVASGSGEGAVHAGVEEEGVVPPSGHEVEEREEVASPPIQPPAMWMAKAPASSFSSSSEQRAEEAKPDHQEVPASTLTSSAAVPPPVPALVAFLAPSVPLSKPHQQPSPVPEEDEGEVYTGAKHVLQRSITEESLRAVGAGNTSTEEARTVKDEEAGGGGSSDEGGGDVQYNVVENPRFSTVPTEGVPAVVAEGAGESAKEQEKTQGGAKRMSSIKSALLAPVAGTLVPEDEDHQKDTPTAVANTNTNTEAAATVAATHPTTATATAPLNPTPSVTSHKQGVLSRLFGRGKERRGSVGSAIDAGYHREPPPPVPSLPAQYVNSNAAAPAAANAESTANANVVVNEVVPSSPVVQHHPRSEQPETQREPIDPTRKLSKLQKPKEKERKEEGSSPTKQTGFLGGLRGFFGADLAVDDGVGKGKSGLKRKGMGSESSASIAGGVVNLPPTTATETVWVAHPQPHTVSGSSESPMKKHKKQQRSSSLSVFFGRNHPHQQKVAAAQVEGDGVVVEEREGEDGGMYRVVENDVELEKRRERLQIQHGIITTAAAVTDANTKANVAATAPHTKGGLGRPPSKLERRHVGHARAHSVDAVPAVANGDAFGASSSVVNLVSVHAPGRLNVEEIQAQARSLEAATSLAASSKQKGKGVANDGPTPGAAKGWSTRIDRNLRRLKSGDGWSDDDEDGARYVAKTGGGVAKTRELEFAPVVLPDAGMHLRGVEGVQRARSVSHQPLPVEREAGLSRNVSVTSNVSGKSSKLRKGTRSSSVPPPQIAPPASASQPLVFPPEPLSASHHATVSGYTSDTGIVDLGRANSSPRSPPIIKPRRSTSLMSPPPGIPASAAPAQNQYGVTVLSAGGEHPSGTVAKGASLSRNTSVLSTASAPVSRNPSVKAKTRAQASLGQGMVSSGGGGGGPRRSNNVDHSSIYGYGHVAPGSRSSFVDITPVATSGSKIARGEKRASIPYPVPGVPGAAAAAIPITQMPVPRAPPPISSGMLTDGTIMPMGSGSLLSIVESVARGNRQAEERLRVLKSGGKMGKMDLEVVQAPTRVHRDMLGSGHPMGSGSGASSTVSSAAGATGLGRRVSASSASRPAQSPLKSALRNPSSRTPSPMGVQPRVAVPPGHSSLQHQHQTEDIHHSEDDEGDSSAYETPGEVSGDDGRGARKAPGVNGQQPTQHQQQAQASTSRTQAASPPANGDGVPRAVPRPVPASTSSEVPQRRKSVRVSLQPTFSPTPPALDQYHDDGEGREYWMPMVPEKPARNRSKFLTQGSGGPMVASKPARSARDDVWQNSDDEDEEYARAKMMLTRVRAEEKKVYATATSIVA